MLQIATPSRDSRSPSRVSVSQVRYAPAIDAPRVLAILNLSTAWSRGVLQGFMACAHERRWTVLHYPPPVDVAALVQRFAPAAALIGPDSGGLALACAALVPVVSVALDLSSEGIASVCPEEDRIGVLALEHLRATGLRNVSTFQLDASQFGIARERAFVARARQAGASVAPGWGSEDAAPRRTGEDADAIVEWLRSLPKPCGIFTCADHWARIVARYIRLAGLRVPEELALIGVDNDVVECELLEPPLSSVMVPWQEVGRSAAKLVERILQGQQLSSRPVLTAPVGVVGRRSSELLAIEDALVAKALRWIRERAHQRLNVPMVARAVGGGRKRLERRFRRALDRTVQGEIRRARVEVAKGLLQTTRASMAEIAKRSGFTNASLLNVAFRREVGVPPGVYRRLVQNTLAGANDS